MTETEAIERATRFASAEGMDVERFDVQAELKGSMWTVRFEDSKALVDGASRHFAVQVHDVTCDARIFRGR